jgi:hypothetical protein
MHLLDIVVHGRIYCSPYADLNDPFEGQFRELIRAGMMALWMPVPLPPGIKPGDDKVTGVAYHDLMDLAFPNTTRICSLSGNARDVRMWSLYANSHSGVAIEIESDYLDPAPVQVKYDHCLPIGSQTVLGVRTAAADVLSCKSVHWAYEDEYRVITDKAYVSVEGRITRVLFGTRAKTDLIELMDKVMDPAIGMARMRLVPSAVEIEIGEAIPRSRAGTSASSEPTS